MDITTLFWLRTTDQNDDIDTGQRNKVLGSPLESSRNLIKIPTGHLSDIRTQEEEERKDLLLESSGLLNSLDLGRRVHNVREDSDLSTYSSVSSLDPTFLDEIANFLGFFAQLILQPLVAEADEALGFEALSKLLSSVDVVGVNEEGAEAFFMEAEVCLVGGLSTRILGACEIEKGVLARTAAVAFGSLSMVAKPVVKSLKRGKRISFARAKEILTSFILLSTSLFSSATKPHVPV